MIILLLLLTHIKKSVSYFSRKEENKFAILKRMHSIYSYKSKTLAAKFILDNFIPKDDRTLSFVGIPR
jgi:hypothetical protein